MRPCTSALLLVLLSCAASSPSWSQSSSVTVNLDRPFTLSPGSSAVLERENLKIEFDRVVSDSRCPRGAQCITAGEAIVRVWLSKAPAPRERRDLGTAPDAAETAYEMYRLRLVALEPYPAVNGTIRQSDYAATFLITGT